MEVGNANSELFTQDDLETNIKMETQIEIKTTV